MAGAYEELGLQAATDGLFAAGLDTVDQVFWRSGFGASVLGGPTYAGNASLFAARVGEIEAATGATTPVGARPIFIEFAADPAPRVEGSPVNASDYATQRWNLTNASRETGAQAIGLGAAAEAALAMYLLRTNHHANGTQDPAGPLFGATNESGLLALWLVEALQERVNATRAHAAFNGSALGAFDFQTPDLNDVDPANGWQAVPDAMMILLSSDPEPLFQGLAPSDNATTLAGQASLILGLAKIVQLADPAGAYGALFDGAPFDATLYANARELLLTVLNNAQARLWDSTASAYREPDLSSVATADVAFYLHGVATAEKAVADPVLKQNLTAARERATQALVSLADTYGVFPGSYTTSGGAVSPNGSDLQLAAQAAAVEAFAAVFAVTGLKAHFDWQLKAGAGLESVFYGNGSYNVTMPMPELSIYPARAVASTVGAQRDLALTGEEPLAVYRFNDAYQSLVRDAGLLLSAAEAPPVIGASFEWNYTALAYTPASAFDAASAFSAAYEFLSMGASFYTAVGGGVSITESAALRLHNATAGQLGATLDALDQQIAALQGQLAALQAAFDALNVSVSDVESRLNLSLENETISQARIADLQANLTAARLQLENATADRDVYKEKLDQLQANLTDLEMRYQNLTGLLWQEQNRTNALEGDLNVTKNALVDAKRETNTTKLLVDERTKELSRAQQVVALGALGGVIAGILVGIFITRFVRVPKAAGETPSKGKDEKRGSEGEEPKRK